MRERSVFVDLSIGADSSGVQHWCYGEFAVYVEETEFHASRTVSGSSRDSTGSATLALGKEDLERARRHAPAVVWRLTEYRRTAVCA